LSVIQQVAAKKAVIYKKYQVTRVAFFEILPTKLVAKLVEALRYNPGGRGFDSQ